MTPEVVSFELPGVPQPKGRPRFANGRTYTDARTAAAERSVLAAWLHAHPGRAPHTGPVSAELVFVFPVPSSWPKWRRELAPILPHVGKPDLDNLVKVLDGLNGVAWLDDAQLVGLRAVKRLGDRPHTRFTFTFHPQLPTSKKDIP